MLGGLDFVCLALPSESYKQTTPVDHPRDSCWTGVRFPPSPLTYKDVTTRKGGRFCSVKMSDVPAHVAWGNRSAEPYCEAMASVDEAHLVFEEYTTKKLSDASSMTHLHSNRKGSPRLSLFYYLFEMMRESNPSFASRTQMLWCS